MAAPRTAWAIALAGMFLAAASVYAQERGPFPPTARPPQTAPQSCDAPGAPRERAFATPRLKRLLAKGVDVRIAAFGAGLTLGKGASSQAAAYPLQLQSILRRTLKHAHINVDNMGSEGEIAAETAVRILTDLSGDPPAFILWQTGVGDGARDVALTRFETVLRSTIDATRRAGVEMSLVGPPWSSRLAEDAHASAIARSMERVAREKAIAFIDRSAFMRTVFAARGKEEMLSDDGLYLNDFGYRCMAEQVGRSIIEGLRTGNM